MYIFAIYIYLMSKHSLIQMYTFATLLEGSKITLQRMTLHILEHFLDKIFRYPSQKLVYMYLFYFVVF